MTSNSPSNQAPSRTDWHTFFSEAIRLALAPLVLLFAGFFTSNFIISGQYTWPRTSRTLAVSYTHLTLPTNREV